MEMTLQGVRVHYEIGGHGERKVVLLHGWGCSEKLMAGISDALTPDMTVLRVDFPAHGESGFPPQPWGVPDFAANLLELLTKLDFLPCSVIAHSFGGRVAIELAADHPERFDSDRRGGHTAQAIQRKEQEVAAVSAAEKACRCSEKDAPLRQPAGQVAGESRAEVRLAGLCRPVAGNAQDVRQGRGLRPERAAFAYQEPDAAHLGRPRRGNAAVDGAADGKGNCRQWSGGAGRRNAFRISGAGGALSDDCASVSAKLIWMGQE